MKHTFFGFSLLVASVAAFVYVETEAQAQALQLFKPFTGAVNKAVASTLGKRMNTLGFAANDPIYGATLAAAETVVGGAVAAGSVAATVAAVGTAPVWLSVALGIGAAYEIYDFTVGSYDFRATAGSSQLNVTSGVQNIALPPPSPSSVANPLQVPSVLPVDYGDPGVGVLVRYPNNLPICATTYNTSQQSSGTGTQTHPTKNICGADVAQLESIAQQFFIKETYNRWTGAGYTNVSGFTQTAYSGPTKISCTLSPLLCPEGVNYRYQRTYDGTVYWPGTGGTVAVRGVMDFTVFNNPNYTDPNKVYTANDAASKLTSSDLQARADPELLAAIANKIWQQAAQLPGYEGAPYNPLDPVTPAHVLADVAAGLYPHPTNYDLLALPSPTVGAAVSLDPQAAPVTAPASDTVSVDLGPDPGIAAPGLEEVPTGAGILTHVMALLPSVSAFTIPAHTAECVMPSFDFFGRAMTMQGACDLIEQQRALLSTLFTAIWGIAGLVTVLRA